MKSKAKKRRLKKSVRLPMPPPTKVKPSAKLYSRKKKPAARGNGP